MQIHASICGAMWDTREDAIRSAEELHFRECPSGNYGSHEWFLSEVNLFPINASSHRWDPSRLFRYPLAFAAYSNDVYGCLRDRSDNVRLAALKTISNLILKEMVKVRCSDPLFSWFCVHRRLFSVAQRSN